MFSNVPCLHNEQNAQDVFCHRCDENMPFLALSFKVADAIREKLINQVVEKISWEWDRKKIGSFVNIAFNESLQNAVEHGILGIDYESKNRYLKESPEKFIDSVKDQWVKKAKPVTITLCVNHERILLGFHDHGQGFDYKKFADKTISAGNLLEPSGRGIPLLIGIGIQLYWNKTGNSVYCSIPSKLLQPATSEEKRLLKRSVENLESCTLLIRGQKTKVELINSSLAGVEIRYIGGSLPVNTKLHIVSEKLKMDRYARVIWCNDVDEKNSLVGLKFL